MKRWWLLLALPFAACDCAAIGHSTGDLAVLVFEIREADPPGDPRGESLVVVPGAHITLAWTLEDRAERVILAANDEVLGSWSGEEDPGLFEDDCGVERCTTAQAGQILYTLTAIFSESDGVVDSQSLLVTVSPTGLQVLHLAVSPSRLSGSGKAELRWTTAGAYLVELYAFPPGSDARTPIGAFDLPHAHEGSLEREVAEDTWFELVATSPDGSQTSATTRLFLDDQAYFSEFTATPAEVRPGETTTLSWKGVGVERLTILRDDGRPSIGGIAGDEAREGSRTVEVHGEVRFRLAGLTADGVPVDLVCEGSSCRPAEVEVLPPPRTRILGFRADPASIALGEASVLRFEVASADAIRLLWQEEGQTIVQEFGPEAENFEVEPTINTTYTLQAIRQGRVASSAMATVEVRPHAELFVDLDPDTGGVWAGETALVEWSTEGALFIQLDLDGVPLDVEGLDPAGDVLEIDLPELPEGSRLSLVLTAFGPLSLETVSRTLTLYER